MQAHPQRADVLLDDAGLVFGPQVRERDEGARQKAQAEVVVAQHERGAHALGQLAHEAEHAGVAAELHLIEEHAVELEAPALPRLALQFHFARFAILVDVANRYGILGREPPPIDDVAHRLAVHGREVAAGREARVVGGALRLHGGDGRHGTVPGCGRRLGRGQGGSAATGAGRAGTGGAGTCVGGRAASSLRRPLDVLAGIGGHWLPTGSSRRPPRRRSGSRAWRRRP